MKKISIVLSLISIVALVSLCGCGGEKLPDGMPDLLPLTVNVTQGNKPVEDVKLTFYADDLAWGVGGGSDASGKAVIKTQGQYDGAPAGEYKVVASKYYVTPSKYGIRPADLSLVDEWEKNVAEENAPAFLLVAPELLVPQSTTLTVKVEAGKPVVDLDLGEAVEIPVDRKTFQILK